MTATHTPHVGTARLQHLAQAPGPLMLPPSLTTFYFLRHGQTPRNAQRIFQTYAEPLSALGEQQALAAAQTLASLPAGSAAIRTIHVSDATRTLQTAEPIAGALGLVSRPTSALRERHFGDLMGTSSVDIDWDCAPNGGETLPQFVTRTRAALEDALQARHAGPVLVVAHGGNLYVLAAALGMDLEGKAEGEGVRRLLGNAVPLKFEKGADGAWSVVPLVAVEKEEVNLA